MGEGAKSRILSAAADEFAEKGKAGARMQAIADRAGINKAMLNYYFTNKDQLFREVLSEMLSGTRNRMMEELGSIYNARDFILAWVKAHHRNVMENPSWIRLIIHNYLHGDADTMEMIQSNAMVRFLYDKISLFIDRGELNIKDVRQVMLMMLGMNLTSILAHAEFFGHFKADPFCDCEARGNLQDFLDARLEAIISLLDKGLFAK